MPTDKPRFSITLEEDIPKKVEFYKETHKITTRSKAVVELVKLGLAGLEEDGLLESTQTKDLTSLQQSYYALNEKGRDLLLMQARLLLSDKDCVVKFPSQTKTG